MVLLILMAAVLPMVLSSVHLQSTRAAAPARVTIPSMKLPWDKSLTTIPFKGGPFGNATDITCTLENKSIMSGVDFGLPENTNVLSVAAGKVIYAGYTNNQIRNEVRIDHGGGFVTEYWGLNCINPSIVPGVQVTQGQILGLSGYTPCPKCKNGISIHLRMEFRLYKIQYGIGARWVITNLGVFAIGVCYNACRDRMCSIRKANFLCLPKKRDLPLWRKHKPNLVKRSMTSIIM
jgi:hypothetical protein